MLNAEGERTDKKWAAAAGGGGGGQGGGRFTSSILTLQALTTDSPNRYGPLPPPAPPSWSPDTAPNGTVLAPARVSGFSAKTIDSSLFIFYALSFLQFHCNRYC